MGFEQKKRDNINYVGTRFSFSKHNTVCLVHYMQKKKYEKSIHNDNKKKTPIIEQMEIFLI